MDYFSYSWCSRPVECTWFLIGFGALIILVLNIIWLTVYTPKNNTQAFESTAKPTIYASIIGIFVILVLINILNGAVLYDDLLDLGLKYTVIYLTSSVSR